MPRPWLSMIRTLQRGRKPPLYRALRKHGRKQGNSLRFFGHGRGAQVLMQADRASPTSFSFGQEAGSVVPESESPSINCRGKPSGKERLKKRLGRDLLTQVNHFRGTQCAFEFGCRDYASSAARDIRHRTGRDPSSPRQSPQTNTSDTPDLALPA